MNKRVLAVILAMVLAVIGVLFVVVYAKNADKRALGSAELVNVFQVTKTIPAGASVDDLKPSVKETRLPRKAVVKGAISDLGEIDGLASTVELEPGDQLIESRFAKNGLVVGKTSTSVPRGMQEVTISLAVERAVSGIIVPGDIVGVARSFSPVTELKLNGVLVTRIIQPSLNQGGVAGSGNASQGTYLVTLAVRSKEAALIINAAEFGKLYLTKQNEFTAKGSELVKALGGQ